MQNHFAFVIDVTIASGSDVTIASGSDVTIASGNLSRFRKNLLERI